MEDICLGRAFGSDAWRFAISVHRSPLCVVYLAGGWSGYQSDRPKHIGRVAPGNAGV